MEPNGTASGIRALRAASLPIACLLSLFVLGAFARTSPAGAIRSAAPAQGTAVHAQVGGAMNVAATHEGILWLGVGPRLVASACWTCPIRTA